MRRIVDINKFREELFSNLENSSYLNSYTVRISKNSPLDNALSIRKCSKTLYVTVNRFTGTVSIWRDGLEKNSVEFVMSLYPENYKNKVSYQMSVSEVIIDELKS